MTSCRYLKEKINTEEDDRRLLLDSLAKYQSLLDERQGKEQGAGKYYAARGHGTRQGQQLAAAATRLANTNGGEEGRAELMDDIEIDPNELPSGGRHSSKGGTQREIQRLIASDSIDSMEVSKDNQVYLYNLLVGLYEGSLCLMSLSIECLTGYLYVLTHTQTPLHVPVTTAQVRIDPVPHPTTIDINIITTTSSSRHRPPRPIVPHRAMPPHPAIDSVIGHPMIISCCCSTDD